MSAADEILKFFGAVVLYGGGSAVVAFFIFQHLGKGWIDARFSERLEAFKHEQAKELQRLRIEVESVLSGSLKLQELEFSVLPEVWNKLSEAYSVTSWLISPFQQYPDIEPYSDAELEEFLAKSELLETQKAKILSSLPRDRNELYQSQIFWHRLARARKSVGEFHEYVVKRGVFLPPEMRKQCTELANVLSLSLGSAEIGHAHKNHKAQSAGWDNLNDKGKPLHSSIELAIDRRLHSHGPTSA